MLTDPSHQVGTGSVSVAKEVAEVQKLLKASGLTYTMHSAGTTVGSSDVYHAQPAPPSLILMDIP